MELIRVRLKIEPRRSSQATLDLPRRGFARSHLDFDIMVLAIIDQRDEVVGQLGSVERYPADGRATPLLRIVM